MRQLIEDLISAMEYHVEQTRPIHSTTVALQAARDALKSLPAHQEPVATVTSESGNPNVSMSWWHEPALPVGTKLYASPPASKPLTDEEINELWDETVKYAPSEVRIKDFARAIEAAHGIKGDA